MNKVRLGFTLIEVMFVLVIVATLSSLIYIRAFDYIDSTKGKSEAVKLHSLKKIVDSHYVESSDYRTIAKVIRGSLKTNTKGDDVYVSAWKSNVKVEGFNGSGGVHGNYVVTNSNIPKGKGCYEFLSTSIGYNWTKIEVSGSNGFDKSPSDINRNDIISACLKNGKTKQRINALFKYNPSY